MSDRREVAAWDAFVAAHHDAHPRRAHGVDHDEPEDVGVDPDAIRRRFRSI